MAGIDNIFRNFHDSESSEKASQLVSEPIAYVFAYGSLIWNPGFEYQECLTGYIRGYTRRFWQGNVTHRGTVENPGRVVTLVEADKSAITWGCAYKITGERALSYLDHRECVLGGYEVKYTKFYPRLATEHSGISGEAVPVILYIATPTNSYWMGDDSSEKIAQQIANASGPSGHNIEYLFRLAKFMREELEQAHDEHVFTLERLVRDEVIRRKMCIRSVMGERQLNSIPRDHHEQTRRNVTFAHSSRVPEKKLRCLHI